MATDRNQCVFCNVPITNVIQKNNPSPVRHKGFCCRDCNLEFVLPARLTSTKGPTRKGSKIKTCSGRLGYQHGDYHYWWNHVQDQWVGVHVDVYGDADLPRFYGRSEESILFTIKQFAMSEIAA